MANSLYWSLGKFTILPKANAACGMTAPGLWIRLLPRAVGLWGLMKEPSHSARSLFSLLSPENATGPLGHGLKGSGTAFSLKSN